MPALIFDCDGVLADTEMHGHLPAFNQTFAEFGIPLRWNEVSYADKVRIGGGKERMRAELTPEFLAQHPELPQDESGVSELVARMHRRKTEIYTELINSGQIEPRPGIARLIGEAHAAGWQLAVASTSAEPSVRAVLERAVGRELAAKFAVFAGDVVARKKPAPDIYALALRELAVDANDAIVIEDSAIGLRAATAAGIRTVVTESTYTAGEDFAEAALVVSSLGDAATPTTVINAPFGGAPEREVTLSDLVHLRKNAPLPAATEEAVS